MVYWALVLVASIACFALYRRLMGKVYGYRRDTLVQEMPWLSESPRKVWLWEPAQIKMVVLLFALIAGNVMLALFVLLFINNLWPRGLIDSWGAVTSMFLFSGAVGLFVAPTALRKFYK